MTVFLVGAGPGDPGLITVRGLELLKTADVVVYDRLSAPSLLDSTKEGAELIYVGKGPGVPSTPQDEINDILVTKGKNQCVVRLKGGDPFVFARGGEEAKALMEANVSFEVVPGITSAIAVPAYGGVPVTRRYSSTSFTVVTGHEDPTKPAPSVEWESIARVGGTIVILMGVKNLPQIAERLMGGGLAGDTPLAAVRWGTRHNQSTVRSTLAQAATLTLSSPSVIVVGDVASENLDWFESRPLFGRKVIVTRAKDQASRLSDSLRAVGAEVVSFPTIEIADPPEPELIEPKVEQVGSYDWVVFGSANAANRFLAAVGDMRRLGDTRVAVIGPGTADAVKAHHIEADLIPKRYIAEGLIEEFPRADESGDDARSKVLIPRGLETRGVLAPGLVAKGWSVEELVMYQTVPASVDERASELMHGADIAAFASSSAVRNFAAAVPQSEWPRICVAIGPQTGSAATDAGFEVVVEAEQHTIDGLVAAAVSAIGSVESPRSI